MKEYITPNEEALFGANDTETIQNAIKAACLDGCRKIVIPRYNMRTDKTEWRIPAAILLPSNFTVILDNCYMVQETGIYDNMFRNEMAVNKSGGDHTEQENIAIIGEGNAVLDGGVHNGCFEKTAGKYKLDTIWNNNLLSFTNVNGLREENLKITNHRWWGIMHLFCRNVKIKNLDFRSIPHVENMDNIDLRVGCTHFEIENVTGKSGDDTIALNALNGWRSFRHVSYKDTFIHDVKIRNVISDSHTCYGIRILSQEGNKIYNIDVDTFLDSSEHFSKKRPGSTLALGSPLYYSNVRCAPGDVHHINIKNVTSRGKYAIIVNNDLEDSKISNFHLFDDGNSMVDTGFEANRNGPPPKYADTFFKNVTFEHLFYGSNQLELCTDMPLQKGNYRDTAFNLINMFGELNLKDVNIDKVGQILKVNGGLTVNIDGFNINECDKGFEIAEDSAVFIDGEKITEGKR